MRQSTDTGTEETIVELLVKDLAFDGKAVADRDGKVVFVNGGLPGEKIRARIVKSKARYDVAKLEAILEPSELRTDAPCSHFGICGGCTWQDLEYRHQLSFKKKQTIDCLERLGKLDNVLVHDVVGSVERFRYRNKMEFSFHTDPEKQFTLGLHHRGRWDEIFDLEHCHLQSELTNKIVHWMRDYVRDEDLPVYDVKEHHGYMRFLMFRQAKRTADLMVNIVTNYGTFPNRERLVHGMTAAFPEVSTIVHNQNGQRSNIATGEKEEILYGTGYIEERLFESSFRIRANSFFQTNTNQAETLYRTAFDMLKASRGDRVLDLYCGTGSIGILLSSHVGHVIGVELVPDAVAAAKENAAHNRIENIELYEGNVKDFLKSHPKVQERFDIIVIDPPRAGMNPKALTYMLQMAPPKILYISCNPSTFARDAAVLVKAGYKLPEVRPVDMFPHTMHIELVGMFYKE